MLASPVWMPHYLPMSKTPINTDSASASVRYVRDGTGHADALSQIFTVRFFRVLEVAASTRIFRAFKLTCAQSSLPASSGRNPQNADTTSKGIIFGLNVCAPRKRASTRSGFQQAMSR